MSDEKSPNIDDLLNKAEKLKTRASHRHTRERSSLEDAAHGLTSFGRGVVHVKETFLAVYDKILSPLWTIVGPPFRFAGRQYARVWNRYSFVTDKITGERLFSRHRAGVVSLVTLLVFLAFTPTRIGDAIRFVTIEPIVDSVLIAASLRTETFYLTSSEEINPDRNEHSVRGCRNEGPCTERDAVYFRVRPRLSHDAWKLLVHSNPFYVPDHVVAPIAPGLNECQVTYYGYRMTSSWIARLMRSLEVYPTMLEASCRYLGHDFSQGALERS